MCAVSRAEAHGKYEMWVSKGVCACYMLRMPGVRSPMYVGSSAPINRRQEQQAGAGSRARRSH